MPAKQLYGYGCPESCEEVALSYGEKNCLRELKAYEAEIKKLEVDTVTYDSTGTPTPGGSPVDLPGVGDLGSGTTTFITTTRLFSSTGQRGTDTVWTLSFDITDSSDEAYSFIRMMQCGIGSDFALRWLTVSNHEFGQAIGTLTLADWPLGRGIEAHQIGQLAFDIKGKNLPPRALIGMA